MPEIQENTNGVGEIKRIKMDIETLRRNLQFQAARISGGTYLIITNKIPVQSAKNTISLCNMTIICTMFQH